MNNQQVYEGYIPALLGIALAAMVSFFAFGTLKFRNHEVEAALEVYDNLNSVAALKGQISNRNLKVENDNSSELLFSGKGPAANSATLLTSVKNIAVSNGVQILSSEDMPPKTNESGFGVNIQLSGTTPSIAQFLEQIEKQKPLILIDSFTMRGAAMNQGSEQVEPPLTIGLSLRGQMTSTNGGG